MICISIGCKKASEERRGPRAHFDVENEGELGALLLEDCFEFGCRFINQLFQLFENVC